MEIIDFFLLPYIYISVACSFLPTSVPHNANTSFARFDPHAQWLLGAKTPVLKGFLHKVLYPEKEILSSFCQNRDLFTLMSFMSYSLKAILPCMEG